MPMTTLELLLAAYRLDHPDATIVARMGTRDGQAALIVVQAEADDGLVFATVDDAADGSVVKFHRDGVRELRDALDRWLAGGR